MNDRVLVACPGSSRRARSCPPRRRRDPSSGAATSLIAASSAGGFTGARFAARCRSPLHAGAAPRLRRRARRGFARCPPSPALPRRCRPSARRLREPLAGADRRRCRSPACRRVASPPAAPSLPRACRPPARGCAAARPAVAAGIAGSAARRVPSLAGRRASLPRCRRVAAAAELLAPDRRAEPAAAPRRDLARRCRRRRCRRARRRSAPPLASYSTPTISDEPDAATAISDTRSRLIDTRKRRRATTRHESSLTKKVAPGTRYFRYRCSLPGLAGFTAVASPGTIKRHASGQRRRRRERDSNPRYLSVHTISNRAPSATRSSLQVREASAKLAEREGFEPPVLSHI